MYQVDSQVFFFVSCLLSGLLHWGWVGKFCGSYASKQAGKKTEANWGLLSKKMDKKNGQAEIANQEQNATEIAMNEGSLFGLVKKTIEETANQDSC